MICRRYGGAFAGPADERLMRMPWVVKEAIWVLEIEEELAAHGVSIAPGGDVSDYALRARLAINARRGRRG